MDKRILILGGILVMLGFIYKLPSLAFENFNKYDDYIKRVARREGISFHIMKAIIAVESGFNPEAKAKTTSATGLMQMTVAACQDVGVSHSLMTDPIYAISAGGKYLGMKIKEAGSLFGGIRSYFEGYGNYRANINGTANERQKELHAESQAYLNKVLMYKIAMIGRG